MEPLSNYDFEDLSKQLKSPEMLDKITALGSVRTFRKNEAILNEEAYIRSIPIVLSGSIKVMQTDNDYRELFLYYIHPGETCIMSFLGGIHSEKSKVKAIAEETCEVLLIPIENAAKLVKEFPEWVEYIFRIYHKRFEELLEVVNEVSFKKMDARLLQLLRKKSENAGSNEVRITHEQLANELGTARVVVSRLLKQMEKEQLIELGRNRITLM
ncbi:MAG TPA: Crp/Fnr family transcriptional regulator [Balneolaceae bacterium]|nr:Crp/Fnr family transcriptional regulator [Balneolaceae bacterium]|tara:strand:+ start:23745 stop:24383 length:639 start_codon:yes stop_codon:yes gene_type:complete